MRYMRNRSGVVFPYKQDLVDNASLGFAECDMHGVDVEVEVTTLEERLEKKQPRKPKKKNKPLASVLDPGPNPDEQ